MVVSCFYDIVSPPRLSTVLTKKFSVLSSDRAWDLRKKNRKKCWNRSDNKPCRCERHVKNYDFKIHLFLKLTYLIANNCIKLLLLTSEQNLFEMALVKNAARNGAVCYHHDSKDIFVLLCLLLPRSPTLYSKRTQGDSILQLHNGGITVISSQGDSITVESLQTLYTERTGDVF